MQHAVSSLHISQCFCVLIQSHNARGVRSLRHFRLQISHNLIHIRSSEYFVVLVLLSCEEIVCFLEHILVVELSEYRVQHLLVSLLPHSCAIDAPSSDIS